MCKVVVFTPADAPMKAWPQNPLRMACRNIRSNFPDLIMAAHETRTTDQSLDVKQEIDDLMVELQAIADTAMDMAERNVGGRS